MNDDSMPREVGSNAGLGPNVTRWTAHSARPADAGGFVAVGDYMYAMAESARLRAALTELLACNTESSGWSLSMLANRAEFDAMLERSQERLDTAVGAARVALGA